jgi:hypothetical protein
MMMTVGDLGGEAALQQVGEEARTRLMRVAEALRTA